MVSREEAVRAVKLAAVYLLQEQDKIKALGRDPEEWYEDDPHHDDAADWAKLLLEASGRSNLGGCSLCKG